MQLDQFSGLIQDRFLNAEIDRAEIADIVPLLDQIPSNARVEQHIFGTGVPTIRLYGGRTAATSVAPKYFAVPNLEYRGELIANTRDVQDDRVSFYERKAAMLAREVDFFPYIRGLEVLCDGHNALCPDETAFFATTHNEGSFRQITMSGLTGDGNKYEYTTAASADGTKHAVVVTYNGPGDLKPVMWQNRKPAIMDNTAGSPEARHAKTIKYWVDLEGAAFLGWWWNAVRINVLGTPTVTEMYNILTVARAAMVSFSLPKADAIDRTYYPHEQRRFNEATHTMIVSPALETVSMLALGQLTLGASAPAGASAGLTLNNQFYKAARLRVTNYLAGL